MILGSHWESNGRPFGAKKGIFFRDPFLEWFWSCHGRSGGRGRWSWLGKGSCRNPALSGFCQWFPTASIRLWLMGRISMADAPCRRPYMNVGKSCHWHTKVPRSKIYVGASGLPKQTFLIPMGGLDSQIRPFWSQMGCSRHM